jgi:hypothetical protein
LNSIRIANYIEGRSLTLLFVARFSIIVLGDDCHLSYLTNLNYLYIKKKLREKAQTGCPSSFMQSRSTKRHNHPLKALVGLNSPSLNLICRRFVG